MVCAGCDRTGCKQRGMRKVMKRLKYSELPNFIVFILLSRLPKSRRNVRTCEKILNEALNIIKGITLEEL